MGKAAQPWVAQGHLKGFLVLFFFVVVFLWGFFVAFFVFVWDFLFVFCFLWFFGAAFPTANFCNLKNFGETFFFCVCVFSALSSPHPEKGIPEMSKVSSRVFLHPSRGDGELGWALLSAHSQNFQHREPNSRGKKA